MANALHTALYHVRPARLAAALKKAFNVQREVATLADGTIFWVDPVSDFGRRVVSPEGYEREVTALVKGVLRPGDVFVDVGRTKVISQCWRAERGLWRSQLSRSIASRP